MKDTKQLQMEQVLFDYMDQIKYLISADLWGSEVLNCSKNELFVLFLLYRKESVNMTQIAEYLNVPLNTATGIVSRMEKRALLSRTRSLEDKRVVTIGMTDGGKEQVQVVVKRLLHYMNLVFDSFTAEEVQLTFRLLDKVMNVIGREAMEPAKPVKKQAIRKIIIE